MNKGVPTRNLVCKWQCIGCEGKKGRNKDGTIHQNHTFMHEEFYLWHPPHRGFSQVWMSAGEVAGEEEAYQEDGEDTQEEERAPDLE